METTRDAKNRLNELSRGFMHSTILLTACALGVFETMGSKSWKPADLAARLRLDPRALETVLRALASDDLLLCEDGLFRIDPAYAPYLLREGAESQASILNHHYHLLRRWVGLADVLRSGEPVPRQAEGRPEADAERQMRDFICGMADISRQASREVAEKYNFSLHRRMLDLGGGPGISSIVFVRANPHLHAVVFDLPGPLGIAREQIAEAGLADRIKTQAGDYFVDDLGAGYDLVYISSIIHSMGEEETRQLIGKSRRALAPGGTMIIKEFFLDDDRIHPAHAAMFSVNMLIGTERGRSYTVAETRAMAQEAGFRQFETIELGFASQLLVCRLPK